MLERGSCEKRRGKHNDSQNFSLSDLVVLVHAVLFAYATRVQNGNLLGRLGRGPKNDYLSFVRAVGVELDFGDVRHEYDVAFLSIDDLKINIL